MNERLTILQGDALTKLREMPDESVHCCVTSPPYWGLRDYGHNGQIGLERTPQEYVDRMTEIFREVRRVLRGDGTLWLNLGDSYAGSGRGPSESLNKQNPHSHYAACRQRIGSVHGDRGHTSGVTPPPGLKPKDLIGIPWRVALALQADGWYLRSEVTWCKRVPMPESVTDRPTSATEKIFLLTKSPRYYYNQNAIREPLAMNRWSMSNKLGSSGKACKTRQGAPGSTAHSFQRQGHSGYYREDGTPIFNEKGRNSWNYWLLIPEPYPDAHFAVFPTEIPKRAILAGCPVGGTVLDPFAGSGTTGMVALELGRKAVLIELNPDYCKLIEKRCDVTPGMALA